MTLVMVSGDGDDCLGWWIVHDLEHKASAKLNSLGNRGIKLPGCGAYILLHQIQRIRPRQQVIFSGRIHNSGNLIRDNGESGSDVRDNRRGPPTSMI